MSYMEKKQEKRVALRDINRIPMLTWRRLKMNGVDVDLPHPEIPLLSNRPLPFFGEGIDVSIPSPAVVSDGGASPYSVSSFVKAYTNAGYRLHVAVGKQLDQQIEIPYIFNDHDTAVVDDTAIILDESAEATVVQTFRTESIDVASFHAGDVRIHVGPHARLRFIQVMMAGEHATDVANIEIDAAEGAKIDVVHVSMGATRSYGQTKVMLHGDGSECTLGSVYLGDKSSHSDMNYVMEFHGKRTVGTMIARGALLDSATKMFRGTIDFKPGCAQSKGSEEEFSLMLSPTVVNRSIPLILCGEENVEGAHAVSTGKLDQDALFYLNSRGIDGIQARRMLVEAQVAPVVNMIEDELLKRDILAELGRRLDGHV